VVLAGAALAATGCTREQWHRFPSPDDLIAAVPWFAVMHRGIAIQPYQMPLLPPEGIVPVTGTEPPLPVVPQNYAAIDRLANPTDRTAESLELGARYYGVYCLPCHGAAGAGDGPVNARLLVAPSLLTPRARGLSDGYLYAIIRHGRGIMPAYGQGIRGEDRWHVVNYVRQLQGAAR
jgi:mono/diheme cytochrome c family protein